MKRIGILLESDSALGGTFQYSQSILSALLRLPPSDFEVVAVYTGPHWESSLPTSGIARVAVDKTFMDRAIARAWRTLGLPVGVRRRIAPLLNPVAAALVRSRCDLWIFPVQDVWSYEAPVPALATIHDVMHRYAPPFPETGSKRERRRRDRHFSRICKYARGVLVDSALGKLHVIESYNAIPAKVFPLPYIAPSYMSQSAGEIPEEYRVPDKFIFYPAHFWHHKNHVRLLEAIARVSHTCPDIHLVLTGSPKNSLEEVRNTTSRLGLESKVSFVGQVPGSLMPAFYRKARALVMPTFFGPTNIPPLEAFASGCPVAISNIYAIPAQVGDAALLFDPTSVDEIADSIRRLWQDDEFCATLVAKGQMMSEAWGQQQFSEELRRIVDQLTAQRS